MDRIYHTWDKWECYPSGFYDMKPPGAMTTSEAENLYRILLEDIPEFTRVLDVVLATWPNSCEHYLSNENMNRIAWLGQAALACKYRIPAKFRGGYRLLTEDQQLNADQCALDALNRWLVSRGESEHTLETVKSKTQANLY